MYFRKNSNSFSAELDSKPFFTCTRCGTSLLIAIGLTTVIVLVSLGVTTVVVSSIRDSSNAIQASQALGAAESAKEEALLYLNEHGGPGFNASGNADMNFCNVNDANCQPDPNLKATWTIQGQVPATSKYPDGTYGIPTPGTGNIGSDCDSLKAYISGGFYYSSTATPHYIAMGANVQKPDGYMEIANAVDHPCNWNKIAVGDTITIPLYIVTADPNVQCPQDPADPEVKVCNPSDLGLKSVALKIRTPCSDGAEMCSSVTRFNLDTANGDATVKGNDNIVEWQVEGTNKAGNKTYMMGPMRAYNIKDYTDEYNVLGRFHPDMNSEIYESLINGAKAAGDPVLKLEWGGQDLTVSPAKKGFIIDFIKNVGAWALDDAIYKPVLKLNVIHSLKEFGTNKTVPYLEYQILVDSTVAPADTSQTITAEGFSGTFKQVLEVKVPQNSEVVQYVIQQ